MIHLPALIQDLGIILITAAFVSLLFKKLKQPVVLGYLIAGLIVSPHVSFTPTVVDPSGIQIWAEIGVIFLLFSLGLEFSFKKLAQVGKSASITAVVEVIGMLGIGYLTGQVLGWSKMDSLFLGGILSISSTTIIIRAFDELGLKGKKFVSLVFGVLVVEDLVAILLLVLLSTVSVSQQFSGAQLLFSGARLLFFLALWFIAGIFLLPWFLNKVRSLLNEEALLIFSLAMCFLMVIVATHAGFSPALGAFVIGSILAETREGHQIEHLLRPVKDLFAAVFFVSVGMLIDPNVLVTSWDLILLITVITIGGKLLSTGLGALLSGQSVKVSLQSGMSLAQIGEFSFIIATLGVTLKVTSDFLYPIAVAVSAVTTFTTPYLIKASEPFYNWLNKKMPSGAVTLLNRYEQALQNRGTQSLFGLLLETYLPKILFNSVLIVAISLGIQKFLFPMMTKNLELNEILNFVAALVCIVVCSPFFWGLIAGTPVQMDSMKEDDVNRIKSLQLGINLARILWAFLLIGFISNLFTSALTTALFLSGLALLIFVVLIRFANPLYRWFERRFIANLNDKAMMEEQHNKRYQLAPWNAEMAEVVVSADSEWAGKSLLELGLKENYGVTVALIQRGLHRSFVPTRHDRIYPSDKVYLIGTDDHLSVVRNWLEAHDLVRMPESGLGPVKLDSILLRAPSPFLEKNIRECGLREEIHGLIVGIERQGERILNPDSSFVLKEGDLLWVVGEPKLIAGLKNF